MRTCEDFFCKVLLENTLMLLRKDISIGKGSQRHEGVVAERLKDVTCRAAVEWKEQLDSLLNSNPSLFDAIKMSLKKGPGPELARRRRSLGTLGTCRQTRTRRALKTRFGSKRSRLFAGEYPSGSWLCKECGNVNYPNRVVCNLNSCKSRRLSHQPWAAAGRTWKRMAQADKQRRLLLQRRAICSLDNDDSV